MLFTLPNELLLHIAKHLHRQGRAGHLALKALSLTCRSLSPHARQLLFSSIHIQTRTCCVLAIAAFRSGSIAEGSVVRQLSIRFVSNDSITHDDLAGLLAVLPCLSVLAIRDFIGRDVSPQLGAALGQMATMKTLLASPKGGEDHAGILSILCSLDQTVTFDLIGVTMPNAPPATTFRLPAQPIASPTTLRLRQTDRFRYNNIMEQSRLSDRDLWQGFTACCGASMAYLDVPVHWLQPDLLRAIAPTIKALCLRSEGTAGGIGLLRSGNQLLAQSMPRLEALQLPFYAVLDIDDFRAPMLADVRILVVNRYAKIARRGVRNDDSPRTAWSSMAQAAFDTVVIAAADVSWTDSQCYQYYPTEGATALQHAGSTVVDCEHIEYPDLLVLLKTGECIECP